MLKRFYNTDKYYTDEELKSKGIYLIRNKINNKVYVGQTKNIGGFNQRWNEHRSDKNLQQAKNSYFQRSWDKYGEKEFEFAILEIIVSNNKKDFNEREIYWISYYKSNNREFGYNITDGGDGGNGLLGEKSSTAKLKDEQVACIKPRLLNGESPTKIAKEYDVNKSVITLIKRCRTYPHVRNDLNEQLINSIRKDFKGENAPMSILTNDIVRDVKRRLVNGESSEDIANNLNIIRATVDNIRCLNNWTHVAPELNEKLDAMINHRIELTESQLKEIRLMCSSGEFRQEEIGKKFNCSQQCIGDIVNYKGKYVLKENEEYIKPIVRYKEFTIEQLKEIRMKFASGKFTKIQLAKEYDVADTTIGNIVYYENYYTLKDGEEYITPTIPKKERMPEETIKEIRLRYRDEDIMRIDLQREYNINQTTLKDILDYRRAYKLKDGEEKIIHNKDIVVAVDLSIDDIRTIRIRYDMENLSYKQLAEIYSVSPATIKRIIKKQNKYSDVI